MSIEGPPKSIPPLRSVDPAATNACAPLGTVLRAGTLLPARVGCGMLLYAVAEHHPAAKRALRIRRSPGQRLPRFPAKARFAGTGDGCDCPVPPSTPMPGVIAMQPPVQHRITESDIRQTTPRLPPKGAQHEELETLCHLP